ncbi:MAG: aldo/keto reductase [Phycisphaerales bacterium]|nr:aldo/keto reductase [Phycisphaerales bacterium]
MVLATRPLGTTGMQVSVLGLGTVKLGRNTSVKYPRPFELPTDDDARRLLDLASEVGINLLDTAPAYGVSEVRLGALLNARRDRWLLSTKVGEEFDPSTGFSRFDFTPEHTRASVERSLQRLRTDRLDIVLVHSDGDDERIVREYGTLQVLANLKHEGKVRAIGFSPKTPEGALAAMPLSDVLMLTLNPADRAMLPIVRAARGTGILVKKGLLSGHLEGVQLPAAADRVEACLRFLLAETGVSSVVVGTIDPAHLQHDARAAAAALT